MDMIDNVDNVKFFLVNLLLSISTKEGGIKSYQANWVRLPLKQDLSLFYIGKFYWSSRFCIQDMTIINWIVEITYTMQIVLYVCLLREFYLG